MAVNLPGSDGWNGEHLNELLGGSVSMDCAFYIEVKLKLDNSLCFHFLSISRAGMICMQHEIRLLSLIVIFLQELK